MNEKRVALFGVVLWPAFLAAAATVGVLFTLIDPANVHLFGSKEPLSREMSYTVGFFAFWIIHAATSLAAVWLHDKNRTIDKSLT